MNKINENLKPEAPMLGNIFATLSYGEAVNYCVICLRTQQERKLVNNKALKLFFTAMKINKNWKHYHVCHICESQAVKALKFYRAATFAAAIDTIFTELIFQKKTKTDVFQKENFENVLHKCGLADEKSSLADWEAELKVIRRATRFSKTQPLLVDNIGQQPIQNTVISNEIFVIPDDSPDPYGQVTSINPQKCGTTTCPGTTTLANLNAESYGVHKTQFGGQVVPTGTTVPAGSVRDDLVVMPSPLPQIFETFVILDDDEGKDLDIKIEKTLPDTMSPDPLLMATTPMTTTPMTAQSLPANTTDLIKKPPPKLVPLEKLLEKPKEIFTGDGLLLGTLDGKYTLHPIAIKEGVTTIPSLQTNIFNNCCVVNNTDHKVYPVGDKPTASQDLVQASTQASPLPIDTVYCVSNGSQDSINYAALLITNTVKKPPDTAKRSLDSDEVLVTPYKKIKMLPVNIMNSVNDKSRIDWEDKIPADVISFMDAVDPNPDPKMTPQPVKSKSARRKQAQTPIQNAVAKYSVCEVVDLC